MAASNFMLGKASGGILSVSPADGTTNTSLVLPASGTVVATDANGNLGLGVSIATLTGAADKAVHIHANTESQIHLTNTTTGNTSSDGSVVSVDSSGNLYLYNKENANTIIGTNNIERLRVDANGNVGIGVTPIGTGLGKIIEIGNTGNGLWNAGVNNTSVIANAYWNGSNYVYANNGIASQYQQNGGSHMFRTAPSGTAGNVITFTPTMTLDSSGNLALNSGYLSGIYGAITSFGNASTTYFQMIPRNVANNDPVFSSAVGGALKSAILANGNFQSATNSYGGTSDAKLKENVVETSDKLDKLMNVRVVNFNYIGDDQKQIGVIAQEVEKVFPGIVYETKDTEQVEVTKTKEVTDEEGNVTTEEYTETETVETGEVTKNVKYSVIYMMMLKGMQEQQAIINDLKTRIEILEAK